MKKTLSLSLVAGLCLAPLAATPALAATTPPTSTTTTAAVAVPVPVLEEVRIADDGIKTVKAFVTFSGSTEDGFYVLFNPDNGDNDNATVGADGKIRGSVQLSPGALNALELHVYHGSDEPVIVPFEADDRRSFGAPEVDIVEHADTGRADVTVTGEVGARVRLYDARGNGVATADLEASSHTFDIPLPRVAATYTATQKKDAYETPGTPFDLGAIDPALLPDAPKAEAVYRDASRVLLDVKAEARTVIKVRDEDGRIIGCRMVPAGGTSQVFVPLGSDEVDVTVTRGTTESEATPVDLTAAPTR
ncbi:hypothetical protein [Frondihabitans cladoniiphilus]|uniref:Ig-like domain-containing protein n=1 Tax=Frondihabitans cladoniiphilus TaxID=715785 RepID=A0ABP8VW74_9MICO